MVGFLEVFHSVLLGPLLWVLGGQDGYPDSGLHPPLPSPRVTGITRFNKKTFTKKIG